MKPLHRIEQLLYDCLPEGGLKQKLKKRPEDLRFLVVGSIGFSVNLIALWLLHGQLGLPLFIAQLLSAELALLSNFFFHHNWTYQDYEKSSLRRRLIKFHGTAWAGALLGSVVVWLAATYGRIHYLAAVVVGAAAAMGWNYLFNKYVIWAKSPGLT